MKCDNCKGDLAPYENVAPHDCVGNLVARVQQLEGELEMATTCLVQRACGAGGSVGGGVRGKR
jgi:hypothetical protein